MKRPQEMELPLLIVIAAGAVCAAVFGLTLPKHEKSLRPTARTMAEDGALYVQTWGTSDKEMWEITRNNPTPRRLPPSVFGEPSRRLHGGHRWFLSVRESDPARSASPEDSGILVAVRDDGAMVRLSHDPDLQPLQVTPRWPAHADDRIISWVARRRAGDGQYDSGGVYAAELQFDEVGNILSLRTQPRGAMVPADMSSDTAHSFDGPSPDIQSHDWSPDGRFIAYACSRNSLWKVEVATGQRVRLTATSGMEPVWSPDGERIAFRSMGLLGAIMTLRPDGSDLRQVVGWAEEGELFGVSLPVWAPTGRHLLFQWFDGGDSLEDPAALDVCQVGLKGEGLGNLSAWTAQPLIPVAWRQAI